MDRELKVGDWVICIENDSVDLFIRIGSRYQVSIEEDGYVQLHAPTTDPCQGHWFRNSRFQREDPFQTKVREAYERIKTGG